MSRYSAADGYPLIEIEVAISHVKDELSGATEDLSRDSRLSQVIRLLDHFAVISPLPGTGQGSGAGT
ncbi:MAG: hypothetical protein ACRDIC_19745 [bacterium]